MKLHLGTSGFSYPAWKGLFYPKKIKPAEMLPFYATQFSAVEINASFYRMPGEAMLSGWLSQVPNHFRFSLKAPQQITHRLRLVGAANPTETFVQVVQTLGPRLGPLLFQLPPNFKPNPSKLQAFVDLIPQDIPMVWEFRHPGWFEPETFALLKKRCAALCWEESDELQSSLESTANFGYLRLRCTDYDDRHLRDWVERIRAQPWGEVYVFFKHEDDARGPEFASRFRSLWSD